MKTAIITIQFHSYWVAGTGAAAGRYSDVVCHRDRARLPAMPMSQIKGQLRESATRLALAGAGGWSDVAVRRLFGYRSQRDGFDPDHGAAALAFRGDARIAPQARAAITPSDRDRLFRRLAATKIDERGVAHDKTLRAVEAAIPLELVGEIECVGDVRVEGGPPLDWVALLDTAAAATLAFGKLKADGYGRAIAFVEETP